MRSRMIRAARRLGPILGWLIIVACDSEIATPFPQVTTIEISPAIQFALTDTTIQLSARALDASGRAVDLPIVWWSDNPLVATVNQSGLLATLDHGAVRIVASAGGRNAHLLLNIEHHVRRLEFPGSATPMCRGEQQQLSVTILDPHGTPLERAIEWVSSAPDIASVDPTGLVTALAIGRATITATSDGVTAAVGVRVVADVVNGPVLQR